MWFEALRDDMLAALEAVEDEAGGSSLYAGEPPDASPARPGPAPSLTARRAAAG